MAKKSKKDVSMRAGYCSQCGRLTVTKRVRGKRECKKCGGWK